VICQLAVSDHCHLSISSRIDCNLDVPEQVVIHSSDEDAELEQIVSNLENCLLQDDTCKIFYTISISDI